MKTIVNGVVLITLLSGAASASAEELATGWARSYNAKARLIAGSVATGSGVAAGLIAGVELALEPGWKTYWRMPGDAGGIAPVFTFDGSRNLASAEVLYPAPHRLTDPTGTSVGYKGGVIFPIRLRAEDPSKPIQFEAKIEYGICREICVPAEAKLSIEVPAGAPAQVPQSLRDALASVPAAAGTKRATDPVLEGGRLDPEKQRLVFVVRTPGGADGADLFAEAPEGVYLPLPQKAKEAAGDRVEFSVDLSDGVDVAEIAGKTLTLTMIGAKGQAEARWPVPLIQPKPTP